MWRSLQCLTFRPGFLTHEYLAGRRRRYVRPARLFVALSIVFFAVLRFTATPPTLIATGSEHADRETIAQAHAVFFGVAVAALLLAAVMLR